MDKQRWEQIEAIFTAMVELEGTARARELSRLCAGDEDLQQEVETLLAATGPSKQQFARLAAKSNIPLPEAEEVVHGAGARVGAYRLIRQLGRGGMGVVYLAERADAQFAKQVALKVLPLGLVTAEARRRFQREREILAGLEHPNIARLLDGGITDEGTPYYVMEYVKGRPLDRYCDEQDCSIEQRLTLFERVCRAVAYAHRNLVIHRDIKPDNIMVGTDGRPKLLDFGVAKLLAQEDSDAATLTRTDSRFLSLGFAAPELVQGKHVTTACDVYSLGAVLYCLLAGRPPFELADSTYRQRFDSILHLDPPPPSTVNEDAKQAKALRGDLDNIVAMTLRKEPERRYATVEALLRDLDRRARDLPVSARPESVRYQAGKFLRRHRLGMATTALVMLALAGGLAAALWQARVAQAERDAALMEERQSAQVTEFMVGLFAASDPWADSDADVSARELLDRGNAQLAELDDQPLIQAELLHAMGVSYAGLGHYDEAASLVERSLAIRRDRLGPAHIALADSLNLLGQIRFYQGQYDKAGPLYRKALAMRRRLLGTTHEDTATTLNNLAVWYMQRRNYESAESLHSEVLEIRRALYPEGHLVVAKSLNNLAMVYRARGEYAHAEALYREALAMDRSILGNDHPEVAAILNNLGVLLGRQGKLAAAEPYLRESLAISQRALGDGHPKVAHAMDNVGKLLMLQGDYAGAETLYRQALDIRLNALSPPHPGVAQSHGRLGALYYEQENFAAAELQWVKALAMAREISGGEPADVALYAHNLATALMGQGKYAKAEARFLEALSIYRSMFPDTHPYPQATINRLVELYTAMERPEETMRYRKLLVASDVAAQ